MCLSNLGVGCVTAMELLRDFPGTGLEPLKAIRLVSVLAM